jgi:L-ribulose-5-phosphate 4-epimerase
LLEDLKRRVLEGNLDLKRHNLVKFTWGNVSGIDRKRGLVVIKPSGIPYERLALDDLVVVDLEGNVISGNLNPSSDTPTHLELYRKYHHIGGIVHTHSPWAVSWAQAGKNIPALGTTHADNFNGYIPCTRKMFPNEIESDYELNTGRLIVETFQDAEINSKLIPGVLVNCHGPFTWGRTPEKAVYNAVVLEEIAKTSAITINLNSQVTQVDNHLLQKHYDRKHGSQSYYGQIQIHV